ncbi:MAG: FAD-binding oxidoreductase [Geminocystis sp.]|nr:FAD-binding oxidoreductase [Geminocystis sp.]HIK37225.1 FAD-binding oxidoreductase [Geminocystis sp. M7585_C2015_104]MCS7147140.1 FAD-binding oxidoreductase [Geminocystis sp.]MCX8079111.1 FAD-binding oxidoreductase [Geminocystis sp.]MDW8116776.1 FAD-binding oxidoreductase [Geminocystis sp.]
MADYQNITKNLGSIQVISEEKKVKQLSHDYFHFSPILAEKLADKKGDLVVLPTCEEEILRVARICVENRIPITVRGAGTGNYGQCIPLKGGVILDMSQMRGIKRIEAGVAVVEAGVKMGVLEREARKKGWELRMFPSTYKIATLGGFIAGGSGGIGSINYGQLRDRGNVHKVKVVTLEQEPRIIQLTGDETQQVNHAYGTNGIMTEIEIPLAPANNWLDIIVIFDDFMTAVKFGQELADSDGIVKRLISIHAHPIPKYFTSLNSYIPEGKHCAFLLIAENCLLPLGELVKQWGGEISYLNGADEDRGINLIEFTWNHTTLHARNIDNNITYLQTFFWDLEQVEKMYHHFGDEVMLHLEFLRVKGRAIPAGLQLVRYTTEKRLNEIIRYHEENGATIANPHTYILEEGGRKQIDIEQLKFKQMVDPFGLMNPGKMKAWELSQSG